MKKLSAVVSPIDATLKEVKWTSSNEAVAIVDSNGKVTAVGAGNADIIVTSIDGGYTAKCTVTVTARQNDISGAIKNEYIDLEQVSSIDILQSLFIAYLEDRERLLARISKYF